MAGPVVHTGSAPANTATTSVGGAGRRDPLGGLTGHSGDDVEVSVVVNDGRVDFLGRGGDQQFGRGDAAMLGADGELVLNLQRAKVRTVVDTYDRVRAQRLGDVVVARWSSAALRISSITSRQITSRRPWLLSIRRTSLAVVH